MQTQIDLPLAAPGADLATPSRPWPESCTPALRRVLEKARAKGCVRRSGIYADRPQEETAGEDGFDYQTAIDRCIALRWLAPGEAFNTYVLTREGAERLAAPAGADEADPEAAAEDAA